METGEIQVHVDRSKSVFTVVALLLGGVLGISLVQLGKPLYIVAGAIGVILIVASIFSVETGLFVLFFLTYTRFSDIAVHFHNAPSVAKSYIFLMGLVVLIRWIVFGERPKGWQRAVVFIGIYGLVLATSLLYATNVKLVSDSLIDLVKDVFITFIVITLLNDRKRLHGVVWALLFAGIFMGTISVFQYLTGNFGNDFWGFAQVNYMQYAGDVEGYRTSGPVGDPNYYAMLMLVLVPLALERVFDEQRPVLRLAALFALVIIALSVIFTYSRGGFVALAVAVLAWFVFYPPRVSTIPFLLLAGIAFLLLIPKEYMARITTLTELVTAPSVGFRTQDISLRGRATETLAGLEMFRQHPLLGVGFANYTEHYLAYAKNLGLAPTATVRAAHSLYIEVLAETGLIGVSAFFALLVAMVKGILDSWKRLRSAREDEIARMVAGIGAGLMGYLSAAVFIHAAYPRYFWLLMGVALSIPNIVKNELEGRR